MSGRVLALAVLALLALPGTAAAAVDLENDYDVRFDGGSPGGDELGRSVDGVGDLNGDGHRDVLLGAPLADNNGRTDSGTAYLMFGEQPPRHLVDIQALGSQGIRLDGAQAGDQAGRAVAGAGDVNGDGRPDVVVGAPQASAPGRPGSGRAFVVFGSTSPNPTIDLGALGAAGQSYDALTGESAGVAVAGLGDINDDGRDDIGIGAPAAGHNGRAGSGSVYVVYGHAAAGNVDVGALAPPNGFRIDGGAAGDHLGTSVAGGGDLNGDGGPDLIVGAPDAGGAVTGRGTAYVIYGSATPPAAPIDAGQPLGTAGFALTGVATRDAAGSAVALGNVDADDHADAIVGAPDTDPHGRREAGSVYVRKGGMGLGDLSLGDASIFRFDGAEQRDSFGDDLDAGDVDGDSSGREELVAGAPLAGTSATRADAGAAFVLSVPDASPGPVDLASLDDSVGYRIDGAEEDDFAGTSVSAAGDLNGDSIGDVLLGAPLASNNKRPSSGSAYEVFGTLVKRTLTVGFAGSGTGQVTSSPAGIACTGGSGCQASFDEGTPVTLTATPASGSTFAGFTGGGCSGSGTTCLVTMSQDLAVTAAFGKAPPPPPPPPPPDTRAPVTQITDQPKSTVKKKSVEFEFEADESNVTFGCRLDDADFSSCSSPNRVSGLKKGRHTFQVRATDAAGNTGDPASDTFKVKKKKKKRKGGGR